MKADSLPFKETGYFSKIIIDYLKGDTSLQAFYQYKPNIENFSEVIKNKEFSIENRLVLSQALIEQYKIDKVNLKQFNQVAENIAKVKELDTFTVTTGHQLCLFTGPLYFIYKIASIIKLCKILKEKHPDNNFVPVYWMATEDHDFKEINHFNFNEKKYEWHTDQTGAVGRMQTIGLDKVFNDFSNELTDYSTNATQLINLFYKAYIEHNTLAAATRHLVNQLFGAYGVVIIDGDDVQLKKQFKPIFKKELLEEFSSTAVDKQNDLLSKNYKIQVNPREINLFYLKDGLRERIVKQDEGYFVNETNLSFTEQEILEELDKYPERFSPNVLLRPIYQEQILPNIAYVGGGGELAYWFQLKGVFDTLALPMPMLILRNSVAWLNRKQTKLLAKLDLSLQDLFLEKGILLKTLIKRDSKIDLELKTEIQANQKFFTELQSKAERLDKSLIEHIEAVKTQQKNLLTNLSEKFIRAERREQKEKAAQVNKLKEALFPNNGLQERTSNFSEIYAREGAGMIDYLIDILEVPTDSFSVVKSLN